MNLYKETNVTGTEYRRAKIVQVSNEYNQTPSVTFIEESVTQLGTKVIREICDTLYAPYESSKVIALLNPVTGEPIGQDITQEYLMVILYSLYMQLAKERDVRNEANTNSPGPAP